MKILHLISSGGMYGAEAVILNLSRVLNSSGEHQSVLGVFATHGKSHVALHEAALSAGIESHVIPCRGQVDRSVPGDIRSLARQAKADIIHTHGYKPDVYAWIAQRRTSVALVSTCHTWYDNDFALRVYGVLDRWVLRSYDSVIAVSDEVRARLLRAGVAPQRVQFIRNGIDLRPFAHGTEERRQRRAGGDAFRIGLVGRLAPEKGVDTFVRAASDVVKSYPEAQFVVVGDGPDRAALEQLLASLGTQGNIFLAGQRGDMPDFYASIDVLVSASRQEGLPMALLEGMASGLPVVATAVGQVPQVIENETMGRVVPPGDAVALTRAMNEFLGDGELRERIGEAARARISREFSADRMTADYLRVYERALQERSR